MLNNEQRLERCRRAGPLTCEEIGIPKWMKDTDGVVYICGGFTLYKTSKGYRHQDGRFATSTEIHRFGLE